MFLDNLESIYNPLRYSYISVYLCFSSFFISCFLISANVRGAIDKYSKRRILYEDNMSQRLTFVLLKNKIFVNNNSSATLLVAISTHRRDSDTYQSFHRKSCVTQLYFLTRFFRVPPTKSVHPRFNLLPVRRCNNMHLRGFAEASTEWQSACDRDIIKIPL